MINYLLPCSLLPQARLAELECEAEELRQLWRADSTSKAGSKVTLTLMPDVVFFPPEEGPGMEEKEGGSEGELLEVKGRGALKRCNSEKILRGGLQGLGRVTGQGLGRVTGQGDHERSCVRRSEVVTRRGISLLNEVDAQYSALQVKYDELLRRCHQGEPNQTALTPSRALLPCPATFLLGQAGGEGLDEDFHQPEYKALFKEIFTCIQKTKEDLRENRQKPW